MARPVIELSGKRFGRWTVLGRSPIMRGNQPTWVCRCDCGTEKIILGCSLRVGHSNSCGCAPRPKPPVSKPRHGHALRGRPSPTYIRWRGMIDRCYNPKGTAYPKYGAKGIAVCDRWRTSFEAFLEDMGECPPGLTLDRIENARGYEPDNCRWATQKEQQNNRTNNRKIEHAGETLGLTEWARRIGMSRSTLERRLDRYGWTIERALTSRGRRSAA